MTPEIEDFLHGMKHIDFAMKNLRLALDAVHDAITDFYKVNIEPQIEIPIRDYHEKNNNSDG